MEKLGSTSVGTFVSMKREFYTEQINRVLDHIYSHLGEDLRLTKLSDIGGISQYHFHRIFKAIIGMPIGKFVVLKRLDLAASLLTYSQRSIEEIATEIGYESTSSFDKAFRKRFEQNPFEYRKSSRENRIKTLQLDMELQGNVDIVQLEPRTYLFRKLHGSYHTMNFGGCWSELLEYIEKNNIEVEDTFEVGISYDDPDLTSNMNCSYDMCIPIKSKIRVEAPFGVLDFSGGKYACYKYDGPTHRIEQAFDFLYNEWLLNSHYELRDAPPLSRTITSPKDRFITEIYIPIQ